MTRDRDQAMDSNKKTARTAGLLYLIVVVTGIFHLLYVPSQISGKGDAAATVGNIVASESLFRSGIVAGFLCYTAFLVLPFVLYKLLRPVGSNAAALMVAFVVASVPISFASLMHKLDILSLLSGAGSLQALPKDQVQAQVMLSLAAYNNGILACQIFWALWLLPFGYLVFKSGFLPRILGILLMIGCFGYLIDFFGSVLFAGYTKTAIADFVTLPGSLGEIGICLWLLVVGAREPRLAG
jgi:hypothetical protein